MLAHFDGFLIIQRKCVPKFKKKSIEPKWAQWAQWAQWAHGPHGPMGPWAQWAHGPMGRWPASGPGWPPAGLGDLLRGLDGICTPQRKRIRYTYIYIYINMWILLLFILKISLRSLPPCDNYVCFMHAPTNHHNPSMHAV